MRTEVPPASLFTENRQNLAPSLGSGGLAILQSNDTYTSNADAVLPYKQSNDLFYLTGIAQEETVLILFPGAFKDTDREILFLRETNATIAIWEGSRLSKKEASKRTGIERVEWLSAFPQTLASLALEADTFFLPTNEHPRADSLVPSRGHRFITDLKSKFPLHNYARLSPHLNCLRTSKSAAEVHFVKKACEITHRGFCRILPFIKPKIGEWEIEAELIHEFTKSGSRGFAYHPIIASGANTCILHYTANDQKLCDGDLLLLDVAAEYAGWNADMTRTVPVSGKFTPRQRQVYLAVLHVMKFANSILRPGIQLADYQKQVLAEMELQLIDLGLFTAEEAAAQDPSKPLVKKYFMHGTSHHLGLDVHDVSIPNQEIAEGMLLTIEPGIYIRDEKIGIRLENNYLIGAESNLDLMAAIPIEIEEIESLMSGASK